MVKWAFQPPWMKDQKRRLVINARVETLSKSPLFRSSIEKWRCIIPADGFYEWQAVAGQKSKQPLLFRLKSGELFGFAGLYTGRGDADSQGTAVILTTRPNALMEPIHNRMPAILLPDLEADWLDREESGPDRLLAMLAPYPADVMTSIRVSTAVNTSTREGAELIRPLEDHLVAL
jgi:putative SOS response-associated peptidase YedK